MEQKFEGFIDNMLDRIFSNLGAQLLVLNIVLSVFFILLGVFLLRKQMSKNMNIIGWACFIIGSLGIMSRVVQFIII